MNKPFLNFVCDEKSWGDLLGIIKEPMRFSQPDKYDSDLVNKSGRPLFVSFEAFDCHVYPPSRPTK